MPTLGGAEMKGGRRRLAAISRKRESWPASAPRKVTSAGTEEAPARDDADEKGTPTCVDAPERTCVRLRRQRSVASTP